MDKMYALVDGREGEGEGEGGRGRDVPAGPPRVAVRR